MKPDKELIKKVIKVKDIIDLGSSDKSISIKTLSSEFEIDRKILGKIFKELFDETIYDWLNKVRIEKAEKFLKVNQHEIREIARLTGFSSRIHFYRVFKKIKGVSPKEYMNKLKM